MLARATILSIALYFALSAAHLNPTNSFQPQHQQGYGQLAPHPKGMKHQHFLKGLHVPPQPQSDGGRHDLLDQHHQSPERPERSRPHSKRNLPTPAPRPRHHRHRHPRKYSKLPVPGQIHPPYNAGSHLSRRSFQDSSSLPSQSQVARQSQEAFTRWKAEHPNIGLTHEGESRGMGREHSGMGRQHENGPWSGKSGNGSGHKWQKRQDQPQEQEQEPRHYNHKSSMKHGGSRDGGERPSVTGPYSQIHDGFEGPSNAGPAMRNGQPGDFVDRQKNPLYDGPGASDSPLGKGHQQGTSSDGFPGAGYQGYQPDGSGAYAGSHVQHPGQQGQYQGQQGQYQGQQGQYPGQQGQYQGQQGQYPGQQGQYGAQGGQSQGSRSWGSR